MKQEIEAFFSGLAGQGLIEGRLTVGRRAYSYRPNPPQRKKSRRLTRIALLLLSLAIVMLGVLFLSRRLPWPAVRPAAASPAAERETSLPAPLRAEMRRLRGEPTPDEMVLSPLAWAKADSVRVNAQGYLEIEFPDRLTLVYIPAGPFPMGSADGNQDEAPAREVTLDGFWLQKTETTRAQYARFCTETGHPLPEGAGGEREDVPVVGITRAEAERFCLWLSQRLGHPCHLPSEAQWEKGARGTDRRLYPWGNDPVDGTRANFADRREFEEEGDPWADRATDDGFAKRAPVGSFPRGASPYGLLDMAGNVMEMVADAYVADFYRKAPAANPLATAGQGEFVLRGGGWGSTADTLRGSCRGHTGMRSQDRSPHRGFRVAMTVLPSTAGGGIP